MDALIRDLLDTNKIEANRFAVERRSTAGKDLIRGALLVMAPLAQAKHITLVEELVDVQVSADRERIFQVLSNLIGNAIKFTPEGGTISIRAERRAAELHITISDTGPGIPADEAPHVFDRYWQAKKRRGLGLGLYIAKGIVQAHGGRIWVEAAAGGGTTFGFSLNVVEAGAKR